VHGILMKKKLEAGSWKLEAGSQTRSRTRGRT